MIYSLSSSDPNHYETIDVNINIPWKCEQVKYYVSNVNTMSNFLLTTEEDYLIIVIDGEEYRFTFTSKTDYESSLIKDLKELFNCYDKTKTAVIEKNEHGFGIYYLDSSNYENVLGVDSILAASVRYPKLEGLNVRALGLRLDRQGCISVDPLTMQTSVSHIFAAGEVTNLGMTIARARHDGQVAGKNAANCPQAPVAVEPAFNINILPTDPELAQVGLSYDEVKLRAKRGEHFVSSEVRISDGIYRISRNDGGTLRLYCDVRTHLILGAEMCMYRAGHIAHLIGMAIMQKLTIEQVASMTFFSPAFEEVVQQACQLAIKNLARKDQSLYH